MTISIRWFCTTAFFPYLMESHVAYTTRSFRCLLFQRLLRPPHRPRQEEFCKWHRHLIFELALKCVLDRIRFCRNRRKNQKCVFDKAECTLSVWFSNKISLSNCESRVIRYNCGCCTVFIPQLVQTLRQLKIVWVLKQSKHRRCLTWVK